MIVTSFCKIDSFFMYFGFLKSTIGKGWFDIFCAGLFIVASVDIMGFVIAGFLIVFGVFFLILGYSGEKAGGEDYDPKNAAEDGM